MGITGSLLALVTRATDLIAHKSLRYDIADLLFWMNGSGHLAMSFTPLLGIPVGWRSETANPELPSSTIGSSEAASSAPGPFSGRGYFRRMGRHTSDWSGNLTADLPGRSGVHLTGRRFSASLFHARFKGSGPLQ